MGWLLTMPSLLHDAFDGLRQFLFNSKTVIAPAMWVAEMLRKIGIDEGKICTLRQALPGENRERELRSLPASQNPIRLGYCGRISPEKGILTLVEAVKIANRDKIQFQLKVVGPISGALDWKKKVMAELQCVNAEYAGIRGGKELGRWYNEIDLLVVPSEWQETGPLVVLEAWDLGIPVIGSRSGGIREFLENEGMSQLLFEMNQSASLLETLANIRNIQFPLRVKIPGFKSLAQNYAVIYQKTQETRGEMIR